MNILFEYLLFEMPLGSPKTPSFAHKNWVFRSARELIYFEYLLFEMPLGRHQNTEFCT